MNTANKQHQHKMNIQIATNGGNTKPVKCAIDEAIQLDMMERYKRGEL